MGNSPVCAILISYNPAPDVSKNIGILCSQFRHVVVVDNTPDAETPLAPHDLDGTDACTVIRNYKNLGIAAALNIGIRRAIAMDFQWIVTFDQDSQIREGYVEAMLSEYDEASRYCRVGVVCPRYQGAQTGVFLPTWRAANGDILACMTSGSMLRADTFEAVGPMDELLFIDYVDIEYCLRLRRAGFKVIESQKAILIHSLGNITERKFLGRTLSATNHSAKRRYYITRNRLVLMKRYLFRDPEWVSTDFKSMAVETVKIFLVEKDRLAKARYICQAIYDALWGRLGPRVPL